MTINLPRVIRKKPAQPEYCQQVELFRWAAFNRQKYPELELLYASANGGKRNLVVARKLKTSGVKAGVPDIHLPVPCGIYHGLWVEMKADKGKPTELQLWWHERLRAQGHRVEVCYSWEEAVKIIEGYLGGFERF